jgi:hypothetical protein
LRYSLKVFKEAFSELNFQEIIPGFEILLLCSLGTFAPLLLWPVP